MPKLIFGEQFNRLHDGSFFMIHDGKPNLKVTLNLQITPVNQFFKYLDLPVTTATTIENKYLSEIKIPSDALVYIKNGNYINQFTMIDTFAFRDHPLWSNPQLTAEMLKCNHSFFNWIKNPTAEMNSISVKSMEGHLTLISEITTEICLSAIVQNEYLWNHIPAKLQTTELATAALQRNLRCTNVIKIAGNYELNLQIQMVAEYIKNPTAKLNKLLINEHGYKLGNLYSANEFLKLNPGPFVIFMSTVIKEGSYVNEKFCAFPTYKYTEFFVGGELCFWDFKTINEFRGKFMAEIMIPTDAMVYDRYKTNKFIIKKPWKIEDHPLWDNADLCRHAFQYNTQLIKWIKNQDMLNFLDPNIKWNHTMFQSVKHKTAELFAIAIKHDPEIIKHIPKIWQTDEMVQIAVLSNGELLEFIDDRFQTEGLCYAALRNNLLSNRFIKIPNLQYLCELIKSIDDNIPQLQTILFKS